MKKIYSTTNVGNSGIVSGAGLCFGHSAHWAVLMQKTSPDRTNPELNQSRVKTSLAIHQAMEKKMVELYDLKMALLKVGMTNNDMLKVKQLEKKGTFNNYIQDSVSGFKFDLKSFQTCSSLRIAPMLMRSTPNRTYIINIGGHWLGAYVGMGVVYYFDPGSGLTEFRTKGEFEMFYNNQMIGFKRKMASYFGASNSPYSDDHTPFLLTAK